MWNHISFYSFAINKKQSIKKKTRYNAAICLCFESFQRPVLLKAIFHTPLLEKFSKTCLRFDHFQRLVLKILSQRFHIFDAMQKSRHSSMGLSWGLEPWRKRETPGIQDTWSEVNQPVASYPQGGRSDRFCCDCYWHEERHSWVQQLRVPCQLHRPLVVADWPTWGPCWILWG